MKVEFEFSDKYSEGTLFETLVKGLTNHFVLKFDAEISQAIREELSTELRHKARAEFIRIIEDVKIGKEQKTFRDYLMGLLMAPGGSHRQRDKPRLHALLDDLVSNKAAQIFKEAFEGKIDDIKKDLTTRVGELVVDRLGRR